MDSEDEHFLAIARAEATGSSAPLARALDQLAEYYHRKQRFQEAASAYRRSVGLWRDILGPAHPTVATLLVSLGQIYVHLDQLQEAEPVFRQALTIIESNRTVDDARVAEALEDYAVRLRASGRQDQANLIETRVRRVAQLATVGVRA